MPTLILEFDQSVKKEPIYLNEHIKHMYGMMKSPLHEFVAIGKKKKVVKTCNIKLFNKLITVLKF